eukprot:COSAG03_NODE_24587_length_271_cov_0.761628_1_plen_27_part_01
MDNVLAARSAAMWKVVVVDGPSIWLVC